MGIKRAREDSHTIATVSVKVPGVARQPQSLGHHWALGGVGVEGKRHPTDQVHLEAMASKGHDH